MGREAGAERGAEEIPPVWGGVSIVRLRDPLCGAGRGAEGMPPVYVCVCGFSIVGLRRHPHPHPRSVCGQGVSRARGGGAPPPRHAGGARAGCGAEGDRPAGGGEGRVLGEGKVPQARS